MISPKSIANYFLELAAASGQAISPMKLQKLVYYAHGWYAGYTNMPLIDEPVEAWQYGPVIPSLYHEFKPFGSSNIQGKAKDFTPSGFCETPSPTDPNIRSFLENVWRNYGPYTGIALSEMTHATGTPWYETWSRCAGMKGVDIPFEVIQRHFKEAIEKTAQGQVVRA